MAPVAELLARNLKRRRLERALSLSELARRSGVSKATLSGLEAGSGNPSVDTAWALARALNVPFGELFEDADEETSQVQRLDDAPIVSEEAGFVGRRVLGRQQRGDLEIYVLDLEQGATRHAAPHSPGVVEHVIVMTGRVEVGPEGELAVLEAGDRSSFAADRAHRYHALVGPARILSLTDYP